MTEETQRGMVSRRAFLGALGLACMAGTGVLAGCTGAHSATEAASAPAGSRSGSAGSGDAPATLRIGALKGPTGMGLVGLMDAAGALSRPADADAASPVGTNPAGIEDCGTAYTAAFTLAGSADELAPRFIQGDLDVLCVPANLAATLYAKTKGEVQALTINTLGVLDIIEVGQAVTSIADLKGRTVYAAGKGTTPEFTLAYLLRQNGLEPDRDVTLVWKSEHAECVAALQADPSALAMLPQPFATSALAKIAGARIALDLTKVWDETAQRTGDGSTLVMGVTAVRRAVADAHPKELAAFVRDYARSVSFTQHDPAAASQLIGAAGIIDAAVAERALPYCNIVCITGKELRRKLSGYLKTLADADPATVGGALPGDDFYLTKLA